MIETPHPLEPLPSAEEIAIALEDPESAEVLRAFYETRDARIAAAEADPYHHGYEPWVWQRADEQLAQIELVLFLFGGNGSTKSEWAAKRTVQAAVQNPDTVILCGHESDKTSIQTQQKYIWRYLPPDIKALNGRRDETFKIRYSQAGGFTEGKLVLPNRSEINFGYYTQLPKVYEGWELGNKDRPVIGGWLDESAPLPWLEMILGRNSRRSAKLLWTFAPVYGMTPTIKQKVGAAPRTLESRPAQLLAERVNVDGVPAGEMPFIQEPQNMEKSRVIYFFTEWNPFGKAWQQVQKLCEGQPSNYIEVRAYGYSRDVASRAFPTFSEIHIVSPESLPAQGTNYLFTDPAGARNWASLWCRVTGDKPAKIYIYRDWPSMQRFGEWAVTAASAEKSDGDAGPAQISLGYGVVQYKQLFLASETVDPQGRQSDPYRVRLLKEARQAEVEMPEAAALPVRESIRERYIDSRAGKNEHQAERGGTCLQDDLGAEQRHPKTGELDGPRMHFRLTSGVDIEEGITAINSLLHWDKTKPFDAVMNSPRLFVSAECKQVIWALQNWTGGDGAKGASKDFIDLVRYVALADLRHIEPGMMKTKGGGSY